MAKRTVSGKIISVLLIAHVIVMGFSGFLNAYAEDSGAEQEVAGISLSMDSCRLYNGESVTLEVNADPAGAQLEDVKWETDDEEVATVSADGTRAVVTAAGDNEGTAVITVSASGYTARCSVIVSSEPLMLSALKFTESSSDTSGLYDLSALDKVGMSYDLMIPVEQKYVFVWPRLRSSLSSPSIYADYTDTDGNALHQPLSTEGKYTLLKGLVAGGGRTKNTFTITVENGTEKQVYTVNVYRSMSLSAVSFTSDSGTELEFEPVFSEKTRMYTLTVPADAESITADMTSGYADGNTFYVNGEVTDSPAKITGADKLRKITLGVCDGKETRPVEYTFKISKVPAFNCVFNVSPSTATIVVTGKNGQRITPEYGNTFLLLSGQDYTYTVCADDFVTKSATINITNDTKISVTLPRIAGKAPETSIDAYWGTYFRTDDNLNIFGGRSVRTPAESLLRWRSDRAPLSELGIVDGMIMACDEEKLLLIDEKTGKVIHSAKLTDKAQITMNNKPVYGGGMIFVPLIKGRIQAFNAFTLESLWVYTDTSGSIVSGGMKYDDGCLYACWYGDSSARGALACIPVQDENTSKKYENKAALWRINDTLGFYRTCPVTTARYVIAVSYSGRIICADKRTGVAVQSINASEYGGAASGLVMSGGRIYYSTASGYVCSVPVGDGGLDISGFYSEKVGGYCGAAPLIYNGRLYQAESDTPAEAGYPNGRGPFGIRVYDIKENSLSYAYRAATEGQINTALSMTDAYGDAHIYYTVVKTAGTRIMMMTDRPGMTSESPENGCIYSETAAVGDGAAGAVVSDETGNLYVKLLGGGIVSIGRCGAYASDISVSDADAKIDGGKYNMFTSDHEIVLGGSAAATRLTVTVPNGQVVYIDGERTPEKDIDISGGAVTCAVRIVNGDEARDCTVRVRRASSETRLGVVNVSTGANYMQQNIYTFFPVEELNNADGRYTVHVDRVTYQMPWFLWVSTPVGDNSTLSIQTVSGSDNDGAVLKKVVYTAGMSYYKVTARNIKNMPVRLKITVTAEDGDTRREYDMTIMYDITQPVVDTAQVSLQDRTSSTATVSFTSDEAGTLCYLLYDSEKPTVPTPADYRSNGTTASQKVIAGRNTIKVTGLSKTDQVLYALVKDGAGNYSDYSKPIRLHTGVAPTIDMTGIEASEDNISMSVGDEVTVTATLLPEGTSSEPKYVWTSSAGTVASVNGTGAQCTIRGMGGGTALVSVRAVSGKLSFTDTINVNVEQGVNGISLSRQEISLKAGESVTLSARLLPEGIGSQSNIKWRVSNSKAVKLDADGASASITALTSGTVTVKAIYGEYESSCLIKAERASVDVNGDGAEDIFDYALIIDIIEGKVSGGYNADINGDGTTDMADAQAVLDVLNK